MSFQMMLFKDAPAELQGSYPDAVWFVLSDKGTAPDALERGMVLTRMRKEQGISFEQQDVEFNGKIVFVGTNSVFGGFV